MHPDTIIAFCAILCVPVVIIAAVSAGIGGCRSPLHSYLERRRQAHLDFVAHLNSSIAQLAADVFEVKCKARCVDDEVVQRLLDDAAIYQEYAAQSFNQDKYASAWRFTDKGNVYVRWARKYLA